MLHQVGFLFTTERILVRIPVRATLFFSCPKICQFFLLCKVVKSVEFHKKLKIRHFWVRDVRSKQSHNRDWSLILMIILSPRRHSRWNVRWSAAILRCRWRWVLLPPKRRLCDNNIRGNNSWFFNWPWPCCVPSILRPFLSRRVVASQHAVWRNIWDLGWVLCTMMRSMIFFLLSEFRP